MRLLLPRERERATVADVMLECLFALFLPSSLSSIHYQSLYVCGYVCECRLRVCVCVCMPCAPVLPLVLSLPD